MGIRAGRPRKSKTMSFEHADGGCLHEFSVNLERRTRYSAVVYGWRLVQATAVVKMRLDNISGTPCIGSHSRLIRECPLRIADFETNASKQRTGD